MAEPRVRLADLGQDIGATHHEFNPAARRGIWRMTRGFVTTALMVFHHMLCLDDPRGQRQGCVVAVEDPIICAAS
jgi:hypothetical protein